jgi:hypothetical protein
MCSDAFKTSTMVHDASHSPKWLRGSRGHTVGQTVQLVDRSAPTANDNTGALYNMLPSGDFVPPMQHAYKKRDWEASCSDWYDRGRWGSGKRQLFMKGRKFTAHCEQDLEGGGWTHVATITSGGSHWKFGNEDGRAAPSNAWENPQAVFGDPDKGDYKNHAWNMMPKSQFMVLVNGKHLLTTKECFEGESMLDSFRRLEWDGSASDRKPGIFHRCYVATKSLDASNADAALSQGSAPAVYLKWGTTGIDEFGKQSRVFLSTSHRRYVDQPIGLGVYAREGRRTSSFNVAVNQFAAESEEPGLSYKIYARLS